VVDPIKMEMEVEKTNEEVLEGVEEEGDVEMEDAE
jgi:hypothetical protein